VAPQAGGTPADQPANINVIVPEPKRDFGWWLTTIGTVVVPVLALVLAIVSLVYQNEANQRANQTAQAANKTAQEALALSVRAGASSVAFSTIPNQTSQFEIDNREDDPITSVYIQPTAARDSLDSLGSIAGCRGFTISLPSATAPVMYFKDANGQGWEEPANGTAEPFADPSTFLLLLPASDISARLPAEGPPQVLTGC
jgi:type II secretory pathway pseudopilin PulG